MTHELARALAEANVMALSEYIRLCAANGWQPQKS
jgi:hypothetical protein